MESEMNWRTKTTYPAKGNSLPQAMSEVIVGSHTTFWVRANRGTFLGHILYHIGFFIAVTSYLIVAIASMNKADEMALPEFLVLVFGWFAHTEDIFGTTGALGILGDAMIPIFIFALVCGTVGMSVPFIMSILGKRGMITPIDEVTRAANIRTGGLPRTSRLGYQRKMVGMVVLSMDVAVLSSFIIPMPIDYVYIIHSLFGLGILALFPTTFLFHEIARWGMWSAIVRTMDGRRT
ncbi:MAG: hypothetical protein SVY53_05470 [Chloroflexota bacterium]|nr:hypothetical protein [Chloroflexota bacterium]